ncbi:hypothetical protein MRX96_050710 [Rhipicephalus microplus]|uniref:Tnf receptor-associated factor n=1 Tax=Rhipicephalus microplus TaxID=6941 RepID=A0A9J6E836_RHIMP|nr:hypothetical protein HPB51_008136 [Rhipicephalus microplus]
MGDGGGRFVYRVRGFGSHVDSRLVEFLRELDAVHVCSWCGFVTKWKTSLYSCGDIACKECSVEAGSGDCPVHGKTVSRVMELQFPYGHNVGDEKIRCANVMRGCQFEGTLSGLDTHLKKSCAFHFIACVKCKQAVSYKDMRPHFSTCKGASQSSSGSSAAASLLEDLANARKELDHALALTYIDGESCELRKAVESAGEMFARLQTQLSMAAASLSDGTLALGAV